MRGNNITKRAPHRSDSAAGPSACTVPRASRKYPPVLVGALTTSGARRSERSGDRSCLRSGRGRFWPGCALSALRAACGCWRCAPWRRRRELSSRTSAPRLRTASWPALERGPGTRARPSRRVGQPRCVTRRRPALPADDWTYRPTVLVRRATSQGSGTIIASVEGETLVLTAAHVVRDRGPIVVEFHRYNLGLERAAAAPGPWPRTVRATLLATDPAADLAVLRIVKLAPLPYVARLAPTTSTRPPIPSSTRSGSTWGPTSPPGPPGWSKPSHSSSTDNREQRPFLITEKIPEHGRSGGGLYLSNGELVGVCIGHAELVKGKEMGVFASRESIRILLVDRKLSATIARSESLRARLRGRSPQITAAAHKPAPKG